MSNNKVTVKDIARLTGLSIGTVDRVMHHRKGVSKKSCEKVEQAAKSLGYQLNTNASLLANKKLYRICCLIPRAQSGEYWELIYRGIETAKKDVASHNVTIETISYEQFSRTDFQNAISKLKENLPHAVIIAPMYHSETLALSLFLKGEGIPLVFIDSKVDESEYLAYYGLQMFDSGYLAGSLLLGRDSVKEVVNFRIERGASPIDNPTFERRKGFLDYVARERPDLIIYNEFLKPYDQEYNFILFDKFFQAHPHISHIITFNSRVHLISDYLEKRGMTGLTVLGFDLLEKNTAALKEGYIKYLIVQRTELQIRCGINSLFEYLAFGKQPSIKDNYMPMDILVKENIDYYNEIYKE